MGFAIGWHAERPSGQPMLRNRKLAGWVCAILLGTFTLVNSFACVLYCQFSQEVTPQDRHSCCAKKPAPIGVGTMIRAKGTNPCPADMTLLSEIPLIQQEQPQPKLGNKTELTAGPMLPATSPVTSVSQPLAFSSEFLLLSNIRSSCLFLLESSLRI